MTESFETSAVPTEAPVTEEATPAMTTTFAGPVKSTVLVGTNSGSSRRVRQRLPCLSGVAVEGGGGYWWVVMAQSPVCPAAY